jgi:hypothetical protein
METLSIKSKKYFSLKLIESILLQHSQHWRVEASTGDTLILHGNSSRVYLHPNTESKEHEIHCLWLDYSDVELAKIVIKVIADDHTITVDNDFGTILPGSEFVARCKADAKWDWRIKR